MAILALLATLLFGGLRFGNKAWERAQAAADDISEVQVVQGFLRHRLETTAPVHVQGIQDDPSIDFDGERSRLSFVTVMPMQLLVGGYSRLDLEFRANRRDGDLLLTWRPYRFDALAESRQDASTRILLQHVARLDMAYFGPPDDDGERPPVWQSEWRGRRRLPALVRMRLSFANGQRLHWPELLVAPAITDATP